MKKLIFIILIGIGIAFRLYQVNSLPGGFFIDEINMAVDAKSLIENGTDQYGRAFPFVFEDATDYKLPGYIYAAALSYRFLGPTLLAIRLPSLLASIATIFLLGYFVRLLFPEKKDLSWISMSMLSLSLFAIHFARIAYETTFATFFILLYLVALWQILNKVKLRLWIPLGLAALFVANWTYPAPRFILPVFTVLLLAIWFIRERKKKQVWLLLAGFMLANVISFLPSLIFAKLDSRPLSYLMGNTDLKGWAYLTDRINSISTSLLRNWNLELLFDKGVVFAYRHGTKENGIFLQFLFVPYLVGLWYVIKNFSIKQWSWMFLVTFTLIAGFPSALTSQTPYATRIVPLMTISLPIVISFGVLWIMERMAKQKLLFQTFFWGCVTLLFVYQAGLFAHIYFVHFRTTSVAEFTPAQTRLGQFIRLQLQKNPSQKIYFLNDHTCQNWGNDALHLWYFANLPSKDMITWNNAFKTERFSNYRISPFDAYDEMVPPTGTVSGITLFPGYIDTKTMPTGSLSVYCGIHLGDLNLKDAHVVKIFYWLDDVKSDPYYVVTQRN